MELKHCVSSLATPPEALLSYSQLKGPLPATSPGLAQPRAEQFLLVKEPNRSCVLGGGQSRKGGTRGPVVSR